MAAIWQLVNRRWRSDKRNKKNVNRNMVTSCKRQCKYHGREEAIESEGKEGMAISWQLDKWQGS